MGISGGFWERLGRFWMVSTCFLLADFGVEGRSPSGCWLIYCSCASYGGLFFSSRDSFLTAIFAVFYVAFFCLVVLFGG